MNKKTMVQVFNPIIGKWVKINTQTGSIVSHKKTPGPYKNVEKKEIGNEKQVVFRFSGIYR